MITIERVESHSEALGYVEPNWHDSRLTGHDCVVEGSWYTSPNGVELDRTDIHEIEGLKDHELAIAQAALTKGVAQVDKLYRDKRSGGEYDLDGLEHLVTYRVGTERANYIIPRAFKWLFDMIPAFPYVFLPRGAGHYDGEPGDPEDIVSISTGQRGRGTLVTHGRILRFDPDVDYGADFLISLFLTSLGGRSGHRVSIQQDMAVLMNSNSHHAQDWQLYRRDSSPGFFRSNIARL